MIIDVGDSVRITDNSWLEFVKRTNYKDKNNPGICKVTAILDSGTHKNGVGVICKLSATGDWWFHESFLEKWIS